MARQHRSFRAVLSYLRDTGKRKHPIGMGTFEGQPRLACGVSSVCIAYLPVDTNDAQNLHTTYLKGTEATVKEGYYYAVTSADRYGNESAPLALNHAPELDIPILNQGNRLILPERSDIQEILIYNSIGETISKVKYHPEISLELLPEGFYLVYALRKEDRKTLIGTILK